MSKTIHYIISNAQGYQGDFWVSSKCGLGDQSDRGFGHGSEDVKKVTCRNCLKVLNSENKKI